MPSITKYRQYCKACKMYTLHQYKFGTDDCVCNDCDTTHTPTPYSDIPADILIEQRKRYKDATGRKAMGIVEKYLGVLDPCTNILTEMFSEPGSNVTIVEANAGQKNIDIRAENEQIDIHNAKVKLYKEAQYFKGLGRNDVCLCGTEKKFKNCCQLKYAPYL